MSEDLKPVAKKILEKYPIWTIRENKSIWIYDQKKGFFMPNADTYIGEICVHSDVYNVRSFYNELLFTIKQMTWITIDKFESDPNYINLNNGVYDVVNDKILDHDPKYKFKYTIDIEYDKFAYCPIFEKMVRKMTKTLEDYYLLQRWFGYQFFKSLQRIEKKSLFIEGPPDAGKTTIFWVLQQINGEGNYSTHSLRDISNDTKYYSTDLYGKSANICGDISTFGPKDVSIFKQLTGADRITGRIIRKMPFSFVSHVKFSFACNKFPYIKEPILSDKAFWNRIMIVMVQKGYEEEDKSVRDKLRKELPGIINWTIEGYKDYIKHGFDCYNKNWEDTRDTWVKNMAKMEPSSRSQIVLEEEILPFP